MLRWLQHQQYPTSAHRHCDDKLELSLQRRDGRTRGEETRKDKRGSDEGKRGGKWEERAGGWKRKRKKGVDERVRRSKERRTEVRGRQAGDERSIKWLRGEEMRRGAEEGDLAGERTGGERTGSAWDSSDFLWAIRRIKWVADKGKSVSFYKHWHWISKFGRLWTGHRYGCMWRRSGSWGRLGWLTGCSLFVDSSHWTTISGGSLLPSAICMIPFLKSPFLLETTTVEFSTYARKMAS